MCYLRRHALPFKHVSRYDTTIYSHTLTAQRTTHKRLCLKLLSHYDEPGERLGVIPSLLTSALQRGVVPLKTKWDFRLDLRSPGGSTRRSTSGGSRTFPPPPSASDITLKKLEKTGGRLAAPERKSWTYSNALDTAADLCQELLNQVRTCNVCVIVSI